MKNQLLTLLFIGVFFISCKDDDESNAGTTVSMIINDYTTTIDENPISGSEIGVLDYSYSPAGAQIIFATSVDSGRSAITINNADGSITVTDASVFDFERRTQYVVNVFGLINGEEKAEALLTININDVDEDSTLTVQERLDNGETPYEIFQSNFGYIDSLYGKTFAGGYIFYLNTSDGSGLVAANNDFPQALAWDSTSNQNQVIVTGITESAIGFGLANTEAIYDSLGNKGLAAKEALDFSLNGYSDWFLPSTSELFEMYAKLHVRARGGFSNVLYWSSSESFSLPMAANYVDFDTLKAFHVGATPKTAELSLRFVRKF